MHDMKAYGSVCVRLHSFSSSAVYTTAALPAKKQPPGIPISKKAV